MRLLLIIIFYLAVCPLSWAQEHQQQTAAGATSCPMVSDIQDKAVLGRYEKLKSLFPLSTVEWQVVASNFPKPKMLGICLKEAKSSAISQTYQDKNGFKITVSYTAIIGPAYREGFKKFTQNTPGALVETIEPPALARRTYLETVSGRPAMLIQYFDSREPNVATLTLMAGDIGIALQSEPSEAFTTEDTKNRLLTFATKISYAAFDALPPLPADFQ